jgi:hypothetical protein
METFSKLQWMDAVRRRTDISADQRIVIMHVGATADQYGNDAWRDNKTVATELHISIDTVTNARKNAAKSGLWTETRPARGGRSGGRSAEYRLTMPAGMVRSGADDSVKSSDTAPEIIRNAAVNGPTQSGEWSDAERTPSGIPSGLPSGSASGVPQVSNASANEEMERLIADWSSRHAGHLAAAEAEDKPIFDTDCPDYLSDHQDDDDYPEDYAA